MNPYLVAFLSQLNLPQATIEELAKDIQVREASKGERLLVQGEWSRECFFVLKGCLRQFAVDEEGREQTYNFFTEGQTAIVYQAYTLGLPSDYTIESIEDAVLIVGDFLTEATMMEKHSELPDITRSFMEMNLAEVQDERANFVKSSPEQRYISLLKDRPDLPDRVPQHQIASYLGMTPESLSRIKKRLAHSDLVN